MLRSHQLFKKSKLPAILQEQKLSRKCRLHRIKLKILAHLAIKEKLLIVKSTKYDPGQKVESMIGMIQSKNILLKVNSNGTSG